MPDAKHSTNGKRIKQSPSSGAATQEASKLYARVKGEGLSGTALTLEVARRLAQSMFSGPTHSRGNGSGAVPTAKTSSRVGSDALTEHSGHLSRKILKFFPFHVRSVPPVDYDAGANADIDSMLPYEQSSIRTITVPAGNHMLCYFAPNSNNAGRYCIFNSANLGTTFFDKTASASWPFNGTAPAPVQALYALTNPPNIRAAFGTWGALDWNTSDSSILGVQDSASAKQFLGGGCTIDAYVGYLGHAEMRWLGPSDNPQSFGPGRPDLSSQVFKQGLRTNVFKRSDTGADLAVGIAVPAALSGLVTAPSGMHPYYAPPPSIPTTDEFTPQALADRARVDILQGGGDTSHRSFGWTFHTEDHMVSILNDANLVGTYQDPSYFQGYGANPSTVFSSGQGWFLCQAVGADVKLAIKVKAHFAGVPGGASSHLIDTEHARLFNNDTRKDNGEHESSLDAHESIVAHTVSEVMEGMGVAGLVKAGLDTGVAKTIGQNIATKAPVVANVSKTVFSAAESGFDFLLRHLGNAAKTILPKVATVGADVAEAAAFMI